jgi:hypothetical protein
VASQNFSTFIAQLNAALEILNELFGRDRRASDLEGFGA